MTSTASTSSGPVRRKRSCLSTSVSARGATTTAAVPVSSERSLPVSRRMFWPGSSEENFSRMVASSSVESVCTCISASMKRRNARVGRHAPGARVRLAQVAELLEIGEDVADARRRQVEPRPLGEGARADRLAAGHVLGDAVIENLSCARAQLEHADSFLAPRRGPAALWIWQSRAGNVSGRMQGFVRTGLFRRLGGSSCPPRCPPSTAPSRGLLALGHGVRLGPRRARGSGRRPSCRPRVPTGSARRLRRGPRAALCPARRGHLRGGARRARRRVPRGSTRRAACSQPVRLDGPLHGVTFHSELPGLAARRRAPTRSSTAGSRSPSTTSPRSSPRTTWSRSCTSRCTGPRRRGGRWRGRLAHPGGLAIDAASFVKRDGTKLDRRARLPRAHRRDDVRRAARGRRPATPEALELRRIVCDAADARLFNVALTPDFNWTHRNHFHLEVTPSPWFYVH